MKKILFKTDVHLDATEKLNPSYRLVKEFAQAWKPDVVVDGGDLFEFEYLSSFSKEKLKRLEGKRFQADYDLGNKELDFWQKCCKTYVQIEGNHDERIVRLIDRDPKVQGLVELSKNLGFGARGIEFYPQVGKVFKMGKLAFIHGFWASKYPAERHLMKYKHNLVFGHVHKFQSFSDMMPLMETEMQAWSIGCLCSKSPDWMSGKPTGWQNGFACIYMDEKSGRFNLYPINISKYNEFNFEGRTWKLKR